jgi:hypothetical protein
MVKGSKNDYHGGYTVTLDGSYYHRNGSAPYPGSWKAPLFISDHLVPGLHTLTISNDEWLTLDIDSVCWISLTSVTHSSVLLRLHGPATWAAPTIPTRPYRQPLLMIQRPPHLLGFLMVLGTRIRRILLCSADKPASASETIPSASTFIYIVSSTSLANSYVNYTFSVSAAYPLSPN